MTFWLTKFCCTARLTVSFWQQSGIMYTKRNNVYQFPEKPMPTTYSRSAPGRRFCYPGFHSRPRRWLAMATVLKAQILPAQRLILVRTGMTATCPSKAPSDRVTRQGGASFYRDGSHVQCHFRSPARRVKRGAPPQREAFFARLSLPLLGFVHAVCIIDVRLPPENTFGRFFGAVRFSIHAGNHAG